MSIPENEVPQPAYPVNEKRKERSDSDSSPTTTDEGTYVHDGSRPPHDEGHLRVDTTFQDVDKPTRSPSAAREQAMRLEDDLAVLEAERVASRSTHATEKEGRTGDDEHSVHRSRSHRADVVDEFDEATNPLHEKAAVYNPPDKPSTGISKFVKRLHESSFIVRYLTYIVPLVLLLLIPLLVGALAYPDASVGGVQLLWFSVWLEIIWLTLWAGRVCLATPFSTNSIRPRANA